ncbi:hypothetical protein IAG44_03505 [Streptomyces roseirectus]|uniref:Uncharacterized protein n=1 Tax=Streptomyces roseirectus TaxID=2768066 RepID=A0A7H0I762_9ACTN|nr:hypothetical protein [Streptomyces roseirectus]QNP68628.1 hypothetical protein IAG44_03505 [Streptomyces roseirectus]
MNFESPLSALFPGTSGRLVGALVGHHVMEPERPLPLVELTRRAAVTGTQAEAALFRLGLLGLLAPRRQGEDVCLVPGHVVWGALRQLADLRGRVAERVRAEVGASLQPPPLHLALSGPVAEGRATSPSDVLELVAVPPPDAPDEWTEAVRALAVRLSRDLGNVVVHRSVIGPGETVTLW